MSNKTKQDDTTFEEYAATKPHLYGNHIEVVRGMVPVYQIRPDCENWIDCTEKYYAEWKGDKRTLYNHAAPCARCAELEATNRQLNREVISVGDEAEDYAGKLAALEAELKERDLQLRHLLCIIHRDGGHHTQAHGLEQSIEDAKEKFFDLRDLPDTIAQQAERIRILEEEDTDCHRLKDSAICMQAEQLAAAEKDAERLNFLDTLSQRVDPSTRKCNWLNSDMHFANGRVTLYLRNYVGRATFTGPGKSVREAIDAAIAAQS